jgi:RimJ/RimL family protein N-acetyltransferase
MLRREDPVMEPPEMINAGAIVLKKWEAGWADAAVEAVRESLPELIRFMPWAHEGYDAEAARSFVGSSGDEWKAGTAYNYAVFTTVGELIGSGGLMARVGPGALEIGYWIHSGHTGRGYATTAATSLAQVGLAMPGIDRIVIKHDAANLASGAVAAKAGFTQVGREEREPQAAGDTGVDLVWELRRP